MNSKDAIISLPISSEKFIANISEQVLSMMNNTSDPPNTPRYLNKTEACKYLGVSYNTFQKFCAAEIRSIFLAEGIYRYDKKDLDLFMEKQKKK